MNIFAFIAILAMFGWPTFMFSVTELYKNIKNERLRTALSAATAIAVTSLLCWAFSLPGGGGEFGDSWFDYHPLV